MRSLVCAALGVGMLAAQTWTNPQFIANGNAVAVSTNGTGTAAVIYLDLAGAIHAAVAVNNVWGAPVTLAPANTSETANIAVAPNGDVLAVWGFRTSNTYVPISAQAAFYSGGKWGGATTISTNVYGNVYSLGLPSIGFDGNSRATLAWEEMSAGATTPCTLTAVTATSASGFGARQAVSSPGTCYGWTQMSVNQGGQAVVVEGAAGILSAAVVAYSRDLNGVWGPAVTREAYQYRQRQPRIALANNGTAVAVWTQRTTDSYAVMSPFGSWSAAAVLPGVSNITGTSYVAIDAIGDAVVAYEQYQLPAGLLATYRPAGGSWQAPVLLESSGPVGAAASPLGSFVIASADAAFVRDAGSSNWQKTTFSGGVSAVAGTANQAIVATPPQVNISTAVIP